MNEEMTNKAKAEFMARAERVSEDDARKALCRQGKAEKMVRYSSALRQYREDVKTFFGMVRDYVNGSYRSVPFGTIASIVGAITYLVSPVDVIPDFIPVVGLLDDAAVIGLCLKLVKSDVDEYREWKANKI